MSIHLTTMLLLGAAGAAMVLIVLGHAIVGYRAAMARQRAERRAYWHAQALKAAPLVDAAARAYLDRGVRSEASGAEREAHRRAVMRQIRQGARR